MKTFMGRSNGAKNSRRKRRCRDSSPMVVKLSSATNLVMGQVKILKRGEKLDLSSPSKELQSDGGCKIDLKEDSSTVEIEKFVDVLRYTGRLGPDPSSVPIPTFTSLWKKKEGSSSWSCSSEGIYDSRRRFQAYAPSIGS